MRVLIVEDDVGIAEFLLQGLSENGCIVDVAEDGKAGFDYAQATAY